MQLRRLLAQQHLLNMVITVRADLVLSIILIYFHLSFRLCSLFLIVNQLFCGIFLVIFSTKTTNFARLLSWQHILLINYKKKLEHNNSWKIRNDVIGTFVTKRVFFLINLFSIIFGRFFCADVTFAFKYFQRNY